MLKRIVLFAFAAAVVLGISSCSLLNKPPVVVVSFSPTYPGAGNTVYLDASQTTDPEGDTLTYTWSLPTIPGGSSTTIDSTSGTTTSFTPDINGGYTVHLIASDGTNSVEVDIDISVSSPS